MRTRDAEKEQLVKQKAIEMLAQGGFEGFSMNKLAKACGISVATLYIYYKDKDDLIIQIAKEETIQMNALILKDFDPNASFEVGLWVQWQNRCELMLQNPLLHRFFEQLRGSTYKQYINENFMEDFKARMGQFVKNAIDRNEIAPLPIAIYWSLAFAPLYSLIRFHYEGRSVANVPFELNEEVLRQTFNRVIQSLKNF